jgi:hypothetical protein
MSEPLSKIKIAYQLPDGAITMQFDDPPAGAPPGLNAFVAIPDGKEGFYLEGSFGLTITHANGIYHRFKGGRNHMVDRLHQLGPNGPFSEFCFCNISQYQYP